MIFLCFLCKIVPLYMRGSRKFYQRGSNFDVFCLFFDGRREDSSTNKSGLLSSRQRNTIEMAFPWRADDGPTLNVGLVAF